MPHLKFLQLIKYITKKIYKLNFEIKNLTIK